MSVDNSELLMLLGGKKSKSTIGIAGQQGFGVGVYGGDPADLTAMGLAPMEGCDNPNSDNYGNYIHTNGSVMVFIPAFCYRIGNKSAPSYSRDAANALEIRDASEGEGDGWILHRAFIDGGAQKLGFFMDKYLCSKDSTGNLAISVKGAEPLSLTTTTHLHPPSVDMPGCSGRMFDAVTLARARGEHYACVSAFQWSAMAMLSLAHGQAATGASFCAWYDAGHKTNFPKGCNYNHRDANDETITFASLAPHYGAKTGSAVPFAKTTHNGQNCGICDINGNRFQPLIGILLGEGIYGGYARAGDPHGTIQTAKEAVKMHDFTKDTLNETTLFDDVVWDFELNMYMSANTRWGSAEGNGVFLEQVSGSKRALCGVVPKGTAISSNGISLFGTDSFKVGFDSGGMAILASGSSTDSTNAGIFYRNGIDYWWTKALDELGLRVAGYAN